MEKMLLKMICIDCFMLAVDTRDHIMHTLSLMSLQPYSILNASTGLPSSSRIMPVVSQLNSSSETGEEQIGPEPVNINLVGKSPGSAVSPQLFPLQSMRHLSKQVILMFQPLALLSSQFASSS